MLIFCSEAEHCLGKGHEIFLMKCCATFIDYVPYVCRRCAMHLSCASKTLFEADAST